MRYTKSSEILVFGSGSVGSIFGHRAQGAKARVTAVCRSNYAAARSRGIEIRSKLWGDHVYQPDRVVRSPREVAREPFDFVVLATKSTGQSTQGLMDDLGPAVSDKTVLVSLQNGVTSEIALRRCGFHNPIISVTCYLNCRQPGPAIVEHISSVKPYDFYLGMHSKGKMTTGDEELDTLVSLDHSFTRVEDVQKQRWEKLVFNTAWSLSATLFQKDTYGLLQDPAAMQHVHALASEAVAVGQAMGVNLSRDLVNATMEGPTKTATIVPSMLQDLRQRRPLELGSLCSAIVGFGHRVGVPTPTLEATYVSLAAVNAQFSGLAGSAKQVRNKEIVADLMPKMTNQSRAEAVH